MLACWLRWTFLGALLACSFTSTAWSSSGPLSSVTLAWDASPSPDVAGYRVYVGTNSQSLNRQLEVGQQLSATVPGLVVGTNYFFAVTAYDLIGLESDFSNVISYTIPAASEPRPRVLLLSTGTREAVLDGKGTVGAVYDILASSDLSSWTRIGSVRAGAEGGFRFVEPLSSTNRSRYYRCLRTSP
jgi:hypothetical protein